MGHFQDNPMGIHWAGIVFGLGIAISMGYWTTDFLVVQRILAAKDLRSAKMAPVIGAAVQNGRAVHRGAAGLLALAVLPSIWGRNSGDSLGRHSYNEVLPIMMARYCGPGLLGWGSPR